MKTYKTSQRIAQLVTKITLLFLFVFITLINIVYFRSWYAYMPDEKTQQILINAAKQEEMARMAYGSTQQASEAENILEKLSQRYFAHKEEEKEYFFIYESIIPKVETDGRDYYILRDFHGTKYWEVVSSFVSIQTTILISSIVFLFLVGLILYITAQRMSHIALKDVYTISAFLSEMNADNLTRTLHLPHLKENDELQQIIHAVNVTSHDLDSQIKAIKKFIGAVSHELRTPLSIISGRLQLVKATHEYEKTVPVLEQQTQLMSRMIEALLISIRYQNTGAIQIESVHIKDIVENAITILQELYHDKNIHVTLGDMHDAVTQVHMGIAEIIIRNIFDNAWKYSPVGGEIFISIEDSQITIKDSGGGIDPMYLQYVRDPFWQSEEAKATQKGFGLGLYIVRQLADIVHRDVQLCNAEDGGLQVIIHF